jgi:hypothetical protein
MHTGCAVDNISQVSAGQWRLEYVVTHQTVGNSRQSTSQSVKLKYIYTNWAVDNNKSSSSWSVEAGIYCYWPSSWE